MHTGKQRHCILEHLPPSNSPGIQLPVASGVESLLTPVDPCVLRWKHEQRMQINPWQLPVCPDAGGLLSAAC